MSGLKVFVPVKRVVDYAVKIRIRPDKAGEHPPQPPLTHSRPARTLRPQHIGPRVPSPIGHMLVVSWRGGDCVTLATCELTLSRFPRRYCYHHRAAAPACHRTPRSRRNCKR